MKFTADYGQSCGGSLKPLILKRITVPIKARRQRRLTTTPPMQTGDLAHWAIGDCTELIRFVPI